MTAEFHTLNDDHSSRAVTTDAWRALQPFREAGGLGFHNFAIPEVRERYVASCAANGLSETTDPATRDITVDDFQVRLYLPQGTDPAQARRAILFIHGGGWLMGNLETHDSAARRLAVLTGLPTVAVDYRLAPEQLYPAAIDDCRAALRWLLDSDAEHGLSVDSVCVAGDSAGGQLAAVLANEDAASGTGAVDSQVLIYPITDCSTERTEKGASYQRIESGFPLSADTMRWFIDTYLPEGQDRTVPDLSPLLHPLPEGVARAFVITMDNDPLADEGIEYAAALAKAGVDVEFKHLRGYHHGLFTSAGVMKRGEEELAAIAHFIVKEGEQR
ncbi:Carboxylesterase NlhH [Corynebacterium ciconiae DSM 44920]|uniref:alpha/beta hydrolase n=1 Tax=Corynebacterium ciconiae TaxID=227319 RepID=UPI00037A66EA|nr:alpha/beta hydrolase [Corynebacterium ciconiae]WKD60370.1 Carboxylesterase NlhH [Corynebacterium ciconiae DSM 44920]